VFTKKGERWRGERLVGPWPEAPESSPHSHNLWVLQITVEIQNQQIIRESDSSRQGRKQEHQVFTYTLRPLARLGRAVNKLK
jgi:hypothetical protein